MEALIQLDENLFRFINQGLSSGILDSILIPLRHKLFWIPLYLFIVLFIYMNYNSRRWLIFASIGLTVACSDMLSSKIIKPSVERTRPCHIEELTPEARIPCSHGYSFTSSHATNHFAIGTFLFFIFAWTKWRRGLLLWAGVISIAQVYVGVHYPFDVICGAIVGFLVGLFTFTIFNLLSKKISPELV